jgi:hypothetical protein
MKAPDLMNPHLSEQKVLSGRAAYPEALRQALMRFCFDTDQWVNTAALLEQLNLKRLHDRDLAITGHALKKVVGKHSHPARLDLALLTSELSGRLALMPRSDWLRLGICLSFLPYCGHIRVSIDGHFRRAVREHLDESALLMLEQHGEVQDRPVFTAGVGAWRTPHLVALGGVRAGIEQACRWPDALMQRFLLQFETAERAVGPGVQGLNGYWLELACKTIFPRHPWLWS